MQRYFGRCVGVVVVIVATSGCEHNGDVAASFAEARADPRSRTSYHLSVTVRVDGPGAGELDGVYEVDYEKPDKYLTVRTGPTKELSRTIAIDGELFGSIDGGASWEQAPRQNGDFSPAPRLLEMLNAICTVREAGPRVVVETASRKDGCEKPLRMLVGTHGGETRTIDTTIPSLIGDMSMEIRFDLGRGIVPIQKP